MSCGDTSAKKKKQKDCRQRKDEDLAWAPQRNMSNWPDWEEARSVWKKASGGWSLKRAEIIIVSDAVEGTFVDLDGESRRERVDAKLSKRERKAPNEECEEIESPKWKVIRVESEETQDCVREAKSTE